MFKKWSRIISVSNLDPTAAYLSQTIAKYLPLQTLLRRMRERSRWLSLSRTWCISQESIIVKFWFYAMLIPFILWLMTTFWKKWGVINCGRGKYEIWYDLHCDRIHWITSILRKIMLLWYYYWWHILRWPYLSDIFRLFDLLISRVCRVVMPWEDWFEMSGNAIFNLFHTFMKMFFLVHVR